MNTNENIFPEISKEKFEFVQREDKIHDTSFETKPLTYFQDAMLRFARNKGSVICAIIILILALYAIIAPITTTYKDGFHDGYYAYVLPKLSDSFDLGFWNGCKKVEVNQAQYDYYSAIPGAIHKDYGTKDVTIAGGRTSTVHIISLDSYAKVGFASMLLSEKDYNEARAYEQETGIQLLYPVIDEDLIENIAYAQDSNAWYLTNGKGVAERVNGELQNIYVKDSKSEDGFAYYISRNNGSQYEVRVLYSAWYQYKNGFSPCFIFGADEFGYDIFSRLATGARLSLTLSIAAALINLFIGIVIGAIEGYYGGAVDLIIERVKDILYEIPTIVFMSLFQIYFAKKLGSLFSMFICFIAFGWIGISSTVRAQFYRFKGQEYVMAARTLGAKDRRLIFRHIFPNAIGFIITASVLTIPGTIFAESTYSYLGIVNLQSTKVTSVGTMLENGQSALSNYPHCVFFPAIFLSILLICFNIFGNGLRDAFNPSLRGTES